MNFAPTFADYVNSLGRNPDITEEQWNAMSDADKWASAGGAFQIRPNDPRYNDFKPSVGGEAGRNLYLTQGSAQGIHGGLTGSEFQGPGFYAHSEDAESPQMQENKPDYLPFLLPLAFMGAAGFAGEGPFSGLFGGSGGGAASGAAGSGDAFGTSQLPLLTDGGGINAMDTSLVDSFGGGAAAGGLENFGTSQMQPLSGESGINAMNTSLLDSFGAPVTDLSVNAGMGDTLRNLGSSVPGLSSLGGASGLLRLVGAGTSLAGLLGGNHGGGNTNTNAGGGGGGDKGGSGQAMKINRGPYMPNPITQQQLQNFQYARPRGM